MPRKTLTGDIDMKGVLKSRDCTINKTIDVDITYESEILYTIYDGSTYFLIDKSDNKLAGVGKESYPYWILELSNANA